MSENIGYKNFVAASLITIIRVWLLLCEFDYYYASLIIIMRQMNKMSLRKQNSARGKKLFLDLFIA